jgi:hypothetical protein
MLHNLQAIYEQQGSTTRLDQVTARLRILMTDPERAEEGRG